MEYRTYRAEVRHVDKVLPLFEAYRRFYRAPPRKEESRAFLEYRLRNGESVVLLAEDGEGMARGFVQMFPGFSSVRLCRHWILNDLFVEPGARKRGVARLLLQTAVATAKDLGVESLELATEKSNVPARALYESLGWRADRDFDRYLLDVG